MRPSEELLSRFRSLSMTERQTVSSLVDDYVIACRLSMGPNPARSAHWEELAIVRGRKLQAALDSLTEATRKPAKKKSG